MEEKNLQNGQKRILGLSPEASKSLEKRIEQTASAAMFIIRDTGAFSIWYLGLIKILILPYDFLWRLFAYIVQGIASGQGRGEFHISDLFKPVQPSNPVLGFLNEDVSSSLGGLFNRQDNVMKTIEMKNYDRNVVVYAQDDITPTPQLTEEEQARYDAYVRYHDLNLD